MVINVHFLCAELCVICEPERVEISGKNRQKMGFNKEKKSLCKSFDL